MGTKIRRICYNVTSAGKVLERSTLNETRRPCYSRSYFYFYWNKDQIIVTASV